MKPTLWDVMLHRGNYSDYEERHLYFSGNDENEVLNFLLRYLKDKDPEEDGFDSGRAVHFNNKRHKTTTSEQDAEQGIGYGWDWHARINRLNVIYFAK